jgi:3-hydroxyisobutyrate dehydrogenase-like beta-hydroxyacid dehydrogenase
MNDAPGRRVGFIGLGAMGRPMANALLSAGHDVVVYDVSQEAVDRVVQDGAEPARSAQEAAAGGDLVVTMLPRADDVL